MKRNFSYPEAIRDFAPSSAGKGGFGLEDSTRHLSQKTLYRHVHLAVAAIERGCRRMNISAAEMQKRLQTQGLVRSFLFEHYDTLHTQSFEGVAEMTVEALRGREAER